jgi:hypothetical protein
MAEKKFDPLDTNKDGKVSDVEQAAGGDVTKVSAYQDMVATFKALGIEDLGQYIADAIKADPTIIDRRNELIQSIQESPQYAKRFSGLVLIRKHNKTNPTDPIAVMSEAEYLNAETTYKQLLNPIAGMLGDSVNDEIGKLIGNNVSPVEVQSRIQIATNWAQAADPGIKKALKDFYGVDENALVGYALDPVRGTAQIQKMAGMATLSAQAAQTSVSIDKAYGENLLQSLIDLGQADNAVQAGLLATAKLQDITTGTATAYNPNAGTLGTLTKLADIEGTDLTGQEVLGAALGTDVGAATKTRGLKSRERARFSGGQGGTNVLGEQMSGTL